MIFTNIITFLLNLLQYLIEYFPAISVDDQARIDAFQNFFASIRVYANSANWWFPVNELFIGLTAYLGVLFVVYGFRTLLWVASNVSGGIVKK